MTFFFWLDLIATLSMFPDIGWLWDLVTGQGSTPQSGNAAQLAKTSRAGRVTRIIRVIRLIRLIRIVKLYKQAKLAEQRKEALERREIKKKMEALKRGSTAAIESKSKPSIMNFFNVFTSSSNNKQGSSNTITPAYINNL